ncbi:hypothetical protein LPJ53_003668 [Coemansia erecta]|uniref:6,7-dimethyl-8-ribityllumazine synthase n=1 Tax=Coemansia erecta TaxID=147472 RepID=A0A9W7Y062_9FUNG|nr:hypothetical protein LPJ53_003668 [Coemansia erecta]
MTNEMYTPPSAPSSGRRDKARLHRREVERPRWANPPRIGLVYSAENWALIEPLVNELRYELTDNYHFSPVNIRITQVESVHEIPLFISHSHQRSDIVFALGVALKSSPVYEQRLVDQLTQRIAAINVPGRLPVFDCIMVRDDEMHAQADVEGGSIEIVESWARRAIDTYVMLCKPAA